MSRNLVICASCAVIFALAMAGLTSTQKTQTQKRAISGDSPIQLADNAIAKDRLQRQSAKGAKPTPRPLGFFGTIWNLMKEQVNDTKSAYSQINDLVNDQFADTAQPAEPKPASEEKKSDEDEPPPKLTRAEVLKVLERNLIGLRRLYDMEVKLAWEDSKKNIAQYKKEAMTKVLSTKNIR